MGWYRIMNKAEQTECEQCGYPLVPGDLAYEVEDYGHVFCGPYCARKHIEKHEEEQCPDP